MAVITTLMASPLFERLAGSNQVKIEPIAEAGPSGGLDTVAGGRQDTSR